MKALIAQAAAALSRGEIVAFPTETFYGLAVNALDVGALERLRALKGRGAEKAFALIVSGAPMLAQLVAAVPEGARALMEAHWPGPLTLALPALPTLPEAIVQDGFVAARQSSHPVAQALVASLAAPITATSANPADAPPPRTAQEVRAFFGGHCVVLDGGETPGGLPSTLVRAGKNGCEILRHGAVSLVQI